MAVNFKVRPSTEGRAQGEDQEGTREADHTEMPEEAEDMGEVAVKESVIPVKVVVAEVAEATAKLGDLAVTAVSEALPVQRGMEAPRTAAQYTIMVRLVSAA